MKLKDESNARQLVSSLLASKNCSSAESRESLTNALPLSYFDLLDETPDFSEAAILLDDDTIEYCYIKIGHDGSQYFGFNCSLPGSSEHAEILARHKLVEKMEANTFESYPSGKIVLSKGGKILEISLPRREEAYV